MSRLIGQSPRRVEDARFLTGCARFVDDIVLDGMLHAAIVRSPVAHGVVRRIDAAPARAAHGVRAVFAAADLPEPAVPIPARMAMLPGLERFLQPTLARDKVRFVGEPLAVVVAETRLAAEEAAELVGVEITVLPAVTDRETARVGPALFEAHGNNIASTYRVASGDTDAAFAAADYTRRARFRCQRHTGMPMETRGFVAEWLVDGPRLRVWGAAKVAFVNRAILAQMLAMPEPAIEMIEVDVGGGFGVRGEFYPEDFLIPFAARALACPVKWIERRTEHFLAANHSRDVDCELEIACRRDGTILALRGAVFSDIGAYVRTTGGIVTANAARNIPGPYCIDNFACTVEAFLTNKTPIGTYRGPGQVEANFFRERLIDMAAADLGIDPAAMRRRNLVPAAAMPANRGRLVPYPEGDTVYDSGDFAAAFERALAEIGWSDAPRARTAPDGWRHGIGLACFVSSSGVGPRETAKIVLRDGGIDLHVGSSTMGQGHETVFAQICGDALGLPLAAITVLHGSTTHLAQGFGTYHSRAIVMGGSAVLDAARKLVDRLRPVAASLLGLPNAALEFADGHYVVEDRPPLPLADVIAATTAAGEAIEIDGSFDQTRRTYTFGAHAARVAVDPATGAVRLVDYVAVEDIGRIVNPLLAHGQAMGAIVQGLGGTLMEDLVYDADGQLLAGSFMDYAMPRAGDFPTIRCTCLEDAPSPSNPLGVKGAGEGAIVPVAGAIANAIADALGDLQVEIRELPLTAGRLWRAIATAAG